MTLMSDCVCDLHTHPPHTHPPHSPSTHTHITLDSPTSDGSGAAIVCSEEFVKRHGLEGQAVEIVAMEMATDLPSTFNDKSCMKMVRVVQLYHLLNWMCIMYHTAQACMCM